MPTCGAGSPFDRDMGAGCRWVAQRHQLDADAIGDELAGGLDLNDRHLVGKAKTRGPPRRTSMVTENSSLVSCGLAVAPAGGEVAMASRWRTAIRVGAKVRPRGPVKLAAGVIRARQCGGEAGRATSQPPAGRVPDPHMGGSLGVSQFTTFWRVGYALRLLACYRAPELLHTRPSAVRARRPDDAVELRGSQPQCTANGGWRRMGPTFACAVSVDRPALQENDASIAADTLPATRRR
jgi:hypothetical protein